MDKSIKQDAAEEAAKLIKETLASLTQAHTNAKSESDDPKPPRLFLTNGIELIHFKLNFGKDVEITVAIAGEKAKYPGARTSDMNALVVTNEAPSAAA
jgi:hypothetical protein